MALLGRLGGLKLNLNYSSVARFMSSDTLFHVCCNVRVAREIRVDLAENRMKRDLFMAKSIEECLKRTSSFTNEREAVLILNVSNDSQTPGIDNLLRDSGNIFKGLILNPEVLIDRDVEIEMVVRELTLCEKILRDMIDLEKFYEREGQPGDDERS